MHRHANIRHVCETYAAQVLGITPDDITFSVAKMFFAYGIGNTVFFPFSVGATTVLEPRRPTPDVVRERLEADRPTLFFGVPTFYAALTASDVPGEAFASVRLCASAGEPLPAPLQRRFTDRFGVDILDGIGSTEALHIFLSNRPDDIRPGTTGVAVPGYDLRAARHRRQASSPTASRGRCTCAASRSRSATGTAPTPRARSSRASGWSPATPTSATTRATTPAWAATATCSRPAASGSRPAEVESRLLEHDAVREAAVVGIADEDGLDKPVARRRGRRRRRPGRAWCEWCRDGLAHFKAPRKVVFVDDLPKTATGKLQRFKVRDARVGNAATRPRTTSWKWHRELMTDLEVDILIVGAGPVGLYGAYYAGERGLSVRRRRLAERGGRPGDRDVPGEADLRRRRASPRSPVASWSAASSRRPRSATRTYLLGQEAAGAREARRRPASGSTTSKAPRSSRAA